MIDTFQIKTSFFRHLYEIEGVYYVLCLLDSVLCLLDSQQVVSSHVCFWDGSRAKHLQNKSDFLRLLEIHVTAYKMLFTFV